MIDRKKISKIDIELNTLAAAFQENAAINFDAELKRILNKINLDNEKVILDSNGNTVGKVEIYTNDL